MRFRPIYFAVMATFISCCFCTGCRDSGGKTVDRFRQSQCLNDMYPAEATIELRRQVLDLGDKIELPLPGRERKYPGDWDLVLDLRAKLLGVNQAQ